MEAASSSRAGRSLGAFLVRIQPIAELCLVVGLLESELWYFRAKGPSWIDVLVYGTIVLVCWLSHERRRKAGLVENFPQARVGPAWVETLSAGIVLSMILVIAARLVGDVNETFEFIFLDKPPLKFLNWTVGKFGAAFFQQLALQLFLWPVCHEITRSKVSGAVLAASIFGLIHLPSPTLVAITSLAGLVWIVIYQRSGRIAPLIFTHMILATLAHGILPERLTFDMRVGQAATDDMKRFEELNDPRIRLINRRLKHNRTSLKYYTTDRYYQAQGGNLSGLVRGLFRDILGRTATDSDVDFWTNHRLANPRVDIVNVLLGSDEYAAIEEARRAHPDGRVIR